MKRPGYFKIHKIEKNAGVSLAIVMIILVMFTTFSLTLMRGAGAILAQANRRTEQERCYELAKSFAQSLEADLFKHNNTEWNSSELNGTFYRYACNFLNGIYGEYDPAHPELTTYHYSAAINDERKDTYGTVKIALRKETNADSESDFPTKEDEISDRFTLANKSVEEVTDRTFTHHLFTVDVTVTLGEVSYTYETEYKSAESYEVEYRGKNDGGETFRLVYVKEDGKFHEFTTDGLEFTKKENIYYFYNIDKITKCTFERVNPE